MRVTGYGNSALGESWVKKLSVAALLATQEQVFATTEIDLRPAQLIAQTTSTLRRRQALQLNVHLLILDFSQWINPEGG